MGYGTGDLNDPVYALAVLGTDVIVGGTFRDAANISEADFVAKWDGTSWSALGANGYNDGALGGDVMALTVDGTDLYAAGWFTGVLNNGTLIGEADYVAKWDGSDWSAVGNNGSGNGSLNSGVLALAMVGTDLYVGGWFTDVNNGGTSLTAADYIAKWDGSNWSALSSNGASGGSLNSPVRAIEGSGSNVYVGGDFTNVNNAGISLTAADYVAKWDGSNWTALGYNGGAPAQGSLNSSVYALAASGSDLYVGGAFTNVNDSGTVLSAADYIAKWDGANWSALGSNGALNGSIAHYVYDILVYGSSVFVGGEFNLVNNGGTFITAADSVAEWDTIGGNWYALGDDGAGGGSLTKPVHALIIGGSDLYVGGLAGRCEQRRHIH